MKYSRHSNLKTRTFKMNHPFITITWTNISFSNIMYSRSQLTIRQMTAPCVIHNHRLRIEISHIIKKVFVIYAGLLLSSTLTMYFNMPCTLPTTYYEYVQTIQINHTTRKMTEYLELRYSRLKETFELLRTKKYNITYEIFHRINWFIRAWQKSYPNKYVYKWQKKTRWLLVL